MKVLVCVMCLACMGVSADFVLSKNVLDFTIFFNGDFDTRRQFDVKTGHMLIEARTVPLVIQAVYPYPAIYIEEAVNGEVQILQIGAIKDGPYRSVIMQLYNFANYSHLKPYTYDYESVKHVRLEDLSTDDDCFAIMTFLPTLLVTLTFPDCRFTTNGKHPRIAANYTCDGATVVFPPDPNNPSTLEPYSFQLLRPKYPQVHAPEGYVNPCEKKQVGINARTYIPT